jgi:hypothetical protein
MIAASLHILISCILHLGDWQTSDRGFRHGPVVGEQLRSHSIGGLTVIIPWHVQILAAGREFILR